MLSSRPKRYVDCSVQTDPEPNVACNQLSCVRATCAISSFDSNSSLSAKPQAAAESLVQSRTTGYKDAYSHSQASKAGVETLVLPSRQERKQSTIGYGRPSSFISSEKRMTSLPSTVSTGEILGRLDEQVRIASMPERGKFGALQHSECLHVDNSESTDITYHSMDSVQRLAYREYEPTRRYPADLPQTPSPPSSPDSVMIIGNEGQVSGSFLRRPSIDDSGWITWASSPPRPIPALHGPSSLPYARCPSGAEGTLVEGDDLSHKIWGLGIDDAQGCSNSRSNKAPINQNLQQHNSHKDHIPFQPISHEGIGCGAQTPSQHERDAVIDLSEPLTFDGNRSGLASIPHKYAPNLVQHGRNMQLETQARGDSNGSYLEMYNPRGLNLPANMGGNQALSLSSLGLGLNWNNSVTSETRNPITASKNNNDSGNRLNSAAPVFVPQASTGADRLQPKTAYMRPAGNAGSAISQPLDKRSMVNMASQYQNQQDYHLPTPPSTVSPHWSPIFSQPDDFGMSTRKPITKHVQHNSIYRPPKVYSPQPDLEEYASRLSAIVEQLGGHGLDLNVQRFSPIHQFSAQQLESPALQIRSNKAIEHIKPSVQNNEWSHRPLTAPNNRQVISEKETEPINQSMESCNLPFSSERRRNLSYQHARSIPLARLIQRRLSSVAEEDAGRDSLLPLLRKKVSEFTFNRFSQESPNLRRPLENLSDNENFEYTMGDEENVEFAMSIEDPPMLVENSNAIVKLPQKLEALRANQILNGQRSTRSDVGKENDNGVGVSIPIRESKPHGKTKK